MRTYCVLSVDTSFNGERPQNFKTYILVFYILKNIFKDNENTVVQFCLFVKDKSRIT